MDIDLARLKKLCTLDEDALWKKFAKRKDYEDLGLYLFKDNGSKILTVAHMDVFSEKGYNKFLWDEIGSDIIVHSPWLDDRLGVYIADHMLPNVLKIKTDILLTTNEECCQSTAEDFSKEMVGLKDYNWIVEFDRAGEDVVLYHYDDVPELTEDLVTAGFDIGIGSYSDIGELEDFKVGCFNVGIGYHHQHTSMCFASMQEMVNQLVRFRDFYNANKDKKYIYTHKPHSRWTWMDSYYGLKDDDLDLMYGYGNNLVSHNGYVHTQYGTSYKTAFEKRGYLSEMSDEEYSAWIDTFWDDLNDEQKTAFCNGEWEDLDQNELEEKVIEAEIAEREVVLDDRKSESKVLVVGSDLVPYGQGVGSFDASKKKDWKYYYNQGKRRLW